MALAGAASAQTASPAPQTAPDVLEEARKQVAQHSETLLRYEIPMTAEPAFQFKA
jgi:hypothetical protein